MASDFQMRCQLSLINALAVTIKECDNRMPGFSDAFMDTLKQYLEIRAKEDIKDGLDTTRELLAFHSFTQERLNQMEG